MEMQSIRLSRLMFINVIYRHILSGTFILNNIIILIERINFPQRVT